MSHPVRLLQRSECSAAGEVLAEAFREDPSFRYFFPEQQRYDKLAPWLFSSLARWSVLYGAAWTTSNLDGVALRRPPGQDRENLWRYLRSGLIKAPAKLGLETFKKLDAFTEHTARQRPEIVGSKRYWYAWVIGVHPDKQGQGLGKALMQKTFDRAEEDGLPCCLETATEKDLAIHKSQGYDVKKTWQIPDTDQTIYFMVRPAQK